MLGCPNNAPIPPAHGKCGAEIHAGSFGVAEDNSRAKLEGCAGVLLSVPVVRGPAPPVRSEGLAMQRSLHAWSMKRVPFARCGVLCSCRPILAAGNMLSFRADAVAYMAPLLYLFRRGLKFERPGGTLMALVSSLQANKGRAAYSAVPTSLLVFPIGKVSSKPLAIDQAFFADCVKRRRIDGISQIVQMAFTETAPFCGFPHAQVQRRSLLRFGHSAHLLYLLFSTRAGWNPPRIARILTSRRAPRNSAFSRLPQSLFALHGFSFSHEASAFFSGELLYQGAEGS